MPKRFRYRRLRSQQTHSVDETTLVRRTMDSFFGTFVGYHLRLKDIAARIMLVAFQNGRTCVWPAPGSKDTRLGALMRPGVHHGAAEIYKRVQAWGGKAGREMWGCGQADHTIPVCMKMCFGRGEGFCH